MALIRGSNGLAPCPVCLVPAKGLSDLSKTHAPRTVETHKKDLNPATYKTLAEREKKLKDIGLRPVEVISETMLIYCCSVIHRIHSGR